jgi:hypothetical protein
MPDFQLANWVHGDKFKIFFAKICLTQQPPIMVFVLSIDLGFHLRILALDKFLIFFDNTGSRGRGFFA